MANVELKQLKKSFGAVDVIHGSFVLAPTVAYKITDTWRVGLGAMVFESMGMSVTTVTSGEEAVQVADPAKYDLVFMDIHMPVMSGLELLERMQRSGWDVPAIMITGYATVEIAREALLKGAFDFIAKPFKPADLRAVKRVVFLACGTSFHAGLVGEYMIEDLARIPVEVEYASEFRYRRPILDPGTLVFAISQSGETVDTLSAMREAKRQGATVMGITNVVGSTIARESDGGVYIHAGPEIGVASTKAFTCQVTAIAILTLCLARVRNMTLEEGQEIIHALHKVPAQVEKILLTHAHVDHCAAADVLRQRLAVPGAGPDWLAGSLSAA